jgi:hypothetical protein
LVEDAQEILDTADGRDATLAAGRANFRKWLASVLDRPTYGQVSGPGVVINVAQQHLAAHQARKVLTPGVAATAASVETILTTKLSPDGQTYETQEVS